MNPVQRISNVPAVPSGEAGPSFFGNPESLQNLEWQVARLKEENLAVRSELQQFRFQIANKVVPQSHTNGAQFAGMKFMGLFAIGATGGAFLYAVLAKLVKVHPSNSGIKIRSMSNLNGAGLLPAIKAVNGSDRSRSVCMQVQPGSTRLLVIGFNVIDAVRNRNSLPPPFGNGSQVVPLAFVSCAEAGWPDVQYGQQVDESAPDWLKRYLVAKRAVEAELKTTDKLRPIIYRPSLIWDWKKFDVLPVIPIFNLACALGVPFVDKTVRVEALGKAIVAGLVDPEVKGVQRYPEIESLANAL